MANEGSQFRSFTNLLAEVFDKMGSGTAYFVIDTVSKDNTLQLSKALSESDSRFKTIWAPENKRVVDAYLRGYKEALKNGHEFIIEMDAGLSHDPCTLPIFLKVLNEGNECAFGSRFIKGGSIQKSTWKRTFLSRAGTILSNLLLGTKMFDMTSGYQGFRREVVRQFVGYPLRSKAHFYQTELRYLLRKKRFAEVPIHYCAPSSIVCQNSIMNSLATLFHYFLLRLARRSTIL